MNETQRRIINSAIINLEDDLHRAKLSRKLDPGWKSANEESIDEVIAGYEKTLAELKEDNIR